MATKQIITEDMKEFFEDILQCPNCNTQIKDPRILPCHHSFCLNCLREHIQDGLQNCAICQQKVPLPVNNVYGFPKNDILHKILNFLGSSNVDGYYPNDQILGKTNGAIQSEDNQDSSISNIENPDNEIIYKSLEEILINQLKESLVTHLADVYNCPYYFGDMSRLEAEKLLQNEPDGSFLLRNSSEKGRYPYSITFKKNGEISSLRITFSGNQFRFEGQYPRMPNFDSVIYLIENYMKIPNATLKTPVLRKDPFSLKDLSMAIVSDSTTFQEIMQLPIPQELKEYLRLQKLTL